MALNGVIRRFKTGDYTVTRRAVGSMSVGIYTPGAASTFSIEASIQPVTGRELKSLPEGRRADEVRIVFTTTELRTENPSGGADTIAYKGETWEVIRVEEWDHWGATHYRAMIARRGNP